MPLYMDSVQMLAELIERENGSAVNDTSAVKSMSETERNLKALLFCSLFLLGTIGNLLVIFVVKGKRRRSINDVFILNLAISDLAFICLSLPFHIYELFSPFAKSLVYCKIIWPMMTALHSTTVFTLVSMATERSRGILHPLKPRVQLRMTSMWIFFIWLCAVITILPLMIVAKSDEATCAEDWPSDSYRKIYTAFLFGIQYALPSVVIAGAYVRIAVSLVRSRKPIRTSTNSRGHVVQHKTRAENLRIIRTVAAIITLFMACMLPNQIAWMLFDFGGQDNRKLSHAFWNFAAALVVLHSCINPIIYGTLTPQFRRGYARYVRLMFCCSNMRRRGIDFGKNGATEKSKSGRSTNRNNVVYRGSNDCTSFVLNSPRSAAYAQNMHNFSSWNADDRQLRGNVVSAQISLEKTNYKAQSFRPRNNGGFTDGEMAFANLTIENLSSLETNDAESIVQDTKL